MHFEADPLMMAFQIVSLIHVTLACAAIFVLAVRLRILGWRVLSFLLVSLFVPVYGPILVLRSLCARKALKDQSA